MCPRERVCLAMADAQLYFEGLQGVFGGLIADRRSRTLLFTWAAVVLRHNRALTTSERRSQARPAPAARPAL